MTVRDCIEAKDADDLLFACSGYGASATTYSRTSARLKECRNSETRDVRLGLFALLCCISAVAQAPPIDAVVVADNHYDSQVGNTLR